MHEIEWLDTVPKIISKNIVSNNREARSDLFSIAKEKYFRAKRFWYPSSDKYSVQPPEDIYNIRIKIINQTTRPRFPPYN